MLKTTQNQLKREFGKKIRKLRYAIFGKCYDCMCFQADGYYDCKMDDCPLYPYRLKQPAGRTSKSLASSLRAVKLRINAKEKL